MQASDPDTQGLHLNSQAFCLNRRLFCPDIRGLDLNGQGSYPYIQGFILNEQGFYFKTAGSLSMIRKADV